MPNFDQAERVARTVADAYSQGECELDPAAITVRPYGWMFGFRPLNPAIDPLTRVGGFVAVFISRNTGEVRPLGSGSSIEVYLARYEETIPPHLLLRKPEFPPNGTHYRGFFGLIDADRPVDRAAFPELLRTIDKMSSR